jgi:hypothetical protein
MKKYKQFYPMNNQEDEDSSTYPLYPTTEEIYKKGKKKNEESQEDNPELTGLNKISEATTNNAIRI